jgi:hypothetical protein
MSMAQPDPMAEAIRDLIAQARLAYQFSPGSYTMSALNSALAVAREHRRCMEAGDQKITNATNHRRQRSNKCSSGTHL